MHELNITQNMLDLAVRHGQAAGAKRITALNLVVGEFSSVVDDSVQFYWDFVSQGTIAEGAALRFQRMPAVLQCLDCGQEFPRNADFICPACHGSRIVVKSGEEFFLQSIEVEE
jgi:hydrogenase nickel incorporation protein HypA/HybF